MTAHAFFAPSAAGEWVNCARSLDTPPSGASRDDTDESAEGTLAHATYAALVKGQPLPAGATEEMVRYGETLRNHVGDRTPLHVEERVYAPSIHRDCWGTPDTYHIDHERRHVTLWDYKFGHKFVEPVKNWQLTCYLVAIREWHRLTPGYTYEAWIYQPRCYHYPGPAFRKWLPSEGELMALSGVAKIAAHRVRDPNAPATTGDHCRYCKRRTTCEALMQATTRAVDLSRETTNTELTPEQLGAEMALLTDAMERIKARLTGLEALALHRIREGANVPGWSVGFTRPHEKWTASESDILALAELMGLDISVPKVATPAQARKLGLDESVIRLYSERPSGAAKLTRLTEGEITRSLTP